ncbi:MAG: ABC transporter permease [Clostridia bacterium]|nr:ABC transporter permease [Clostridia bacterium]
MKTTLLAIWEYRDMVISLVKRTLRGRYKGSVLGFFWTFLEPLLQLLVYTVLFSVIIDQKIDKYYLFLFVALIPWMFFSASVSGGAKCISNQANLVTKLYFPREVLPIAHVSAAFINMLLSFLVVFAVVLIARVPIHPLGLLELPVIMLVEYALALGITMIVSACTVYFRDLEYIMGVVTMLWQFLTPIMYNISAVPQEYMSLYMLNPMTPVILLYRDILYYGRAPSLASLLPCALWGAAFLLIGFFVFGRLQKGFAEEL